VKLNFIFVYYFVEAFCIVLSIYWLSSREHVQVISPFQQQMRRDAVFRRMGNEVIKGVCTFGNAEEHGLHLSPVQDQDKFRSCLSVLLIFFGRRAPDTRIQSLL